MKLRHPTSIKRWYSIPDRDQKLLIQLIKTTEYVIRHKLDFDSSLDIENTLTCLAMDAYLLMRD